MYQSASNRTTALDQLGLCAFSSNTTAALVIPPRSHIVAVRRAVTHPSFCLLP
jgi:hypothetical protein